MTVGSKGLTIIAIFLGLLSILCLGLALTTATKYRTQRHRVLELEEKVVAGKGELLKVPQLQLKIQGEQKQRRTVEEELAGLKEEKDALAAEYEGFKKEYELLAAAKAVAGRELQQREIALTEARRNVAELDAEAKELEGLKNKMEKKIAELDLDVRAGATKIKNLSSENESLRKENELLKAEREGGPSAAMERARALEEELERYRASGAQAGVAMAVMPAETSEAPEELQKLRAKVSELTSELVSLTKAKLTAEKTVEELQRQLAER